MPLSTELIGSISIIVTVIIGFLGSFGLYWKQQQDKQRRLRKALKSELESMEQLEKYAEAVTNEVVDQGGWPIPHTSPFVDNVYTGSTANIGILSDEEVAKLTEFYSSAQTVENQIEDIHAGRDDALTKQPVMTIVSLFSLNNKRNDLRLLLAEKLDDSSVDKADYFYVDQDEWDTSKIAQLYG